MNTETCPHCYREKPSHLMLTNREGRICIACQIVANDKILKGREEVPENISEGRQVAARLSQFNTRKNPREVKHESIFS